MSRTFTAKTFDELNHSELGSNAEFAKYLEKHGVEKGQKLYSNLLNTRYYQRDPENHARICAKLHTPGTAAFKQNKIRHQPEIASSVGKLKRRAQKVGFPCEMCNRFVKCEVHHLTAITEFNWLNYGDMGNLAYLCKDCHRLADKGILTEELAARKAIYAKLLANKFTETEIKKINIERGIVDAYED